jgi:5-methylcytosine-specific restriction endonuclease McrA
MLKIWNTKNSEIPEDTKKFIWKKYKSRCAICRIYNERCFTYAYHGNIIHHLISKNIALDNSIDNLMLLCRSCHAHLHGYYKTEGLYMNEEKRIVSFELTKELMKKLKDISEKEKRSISSMIRVILEEAVESKKYN